jgi:hypothetical protein
VLIPAVGASEGARERLNALDFFHKSAPTVADEKELIVALIRYTQQSREANSDRIELTKSALERHTTEGFGNESTQREVYENETGSASTS